MLDSFRRWLTSIRLSDPLQQRQAGLLQTMLLIIIAACVLGLPLNIQTADEAMALLPLISYPLLLATSISALALLRRGQFTASVNTITVGMALAIGVALIGAGFDRSEIILIAFCVPIAMAGLLAGRRGLILAGGVSAELVLITAVLTVIAPGLVGFAAPSPVTPIAAFGTFVLITGVLALFIDMFGTSLRDALTTAQQRGRELEDMQATLERTVRERTASLERALSEGEQREARLVATLADLNTSQATIRELSAPVIPVLPGVLIAPIVGAIDQGRAAVLTSNLLEKVESDHARYVIFDITGVPLLDTHAAHVLMHAATAVRLLGAQTLIVGIRPEVAQTIVTLGIDLSAITSFSNLQEAISSLIERQ
jgi:anti-anti-sigma regulatory factor